jgi:hypothetical protein
VGMALHKDVLKKSLPPGLPPRGSLQPRSGGGGRSGRKKDYSPLPWSDFFDSHQDVRAGANVSHPLSPSSFLSNSLVQ